MMDLSALWNKMFVLFFCLIAGYLAAKAGVINRESNKMFSKLIVCVTNPLQIIASVLTGEHLLSNRDVLVLTLIVVLSYLALIGASFFIPKLLRVRPAEAGVYRFMFIFSNVGFIGYPIVESLFGPSAIFYVSLFVLFFQMFVWSYGVSLMRAEPRFRFTAAVLKKPCVIAALAAYAFYLSGLGAPKVLYQATNYVGALTSPLAMLIIGCSLAQVSFRTVFGNWRIYLLSLIKLVLVPLASFLLLRLFVTNELLLGVVTVVMCMPVATNAAIISYECGADDTLASSGIFLSTLLSIVTLPLMMTLLFR